MPIQGLINILIFLDSNMTKTVLHRNGTITQFDITKIRQVVEWACDGLTNPLELESLFSAKQENQITTTKIQGDLIAHALELTTPQEAKWRYVAGRLLIWDLWKTIRANRLYDQGDVYNTSAKAIRSKLAKGIYNQELLQVYTLEELELATNWIDPDLDKDYDYAGAKLLTTRYLIKDELPQECFLVSALLLAAKHEGDKLAFAREVYQLIALRKISLATPMLANLRLPNPSVTSCFILDTEDNLEHISQTWAQAASISKRGGGIGIRLSKIRATGATVAGRANSSGGVVPWVKILNDIAQAVNQGGKRAGAVTVALDVWHLDVPAFLEMQSEHGDQRLKAFDIFPQLVIPDVFMEQVRSNANWYLVDPFEVKQKLNLDLPQIWGDDFATAYTLIEKAIADGEITLYKKVNAKDLFKQIMRTQIETGLPYLAFKDTINQANPNQHAGLIPCVNLCTESFSNVSATEAHCCDLISLNLANIADSELERITGICVELLDNSLELGNPPIDIAQAHHSKYRVLGLGAMGLADWLAIRRYSYKDNQQEIQDLFRSILYSATKASIKLARVRGAYPAYKGSLWSKGLINGRTLNWHKNQANSLEEKAKWERLFEELKLFGIRNSQLLAIAPNTSSSLIQGCTASILPVYSKFFYDKAKGSAPIAPPFYDQALWYYEENSQLDQKLIVETVAYIQQYIDTGISMELLFNLNKVDAKHIFETLFLAWEFGVKAVYYVRTIQKDDFTPDCSFCAN
jgi:ribonucleoside-diphosphate reductase alpha chain